MKKESVLSQPTQTVYPILAAVCMGHFFNDLMQSVLPASYPLLKESYQLSYAQIGFITFAFQITSSLLQPFVGTFTDKKPQPYSFTAGMFFAFSGITLLAFAWNFASILCAASLIGLGSSIFHPEASRVAYYASGGRRGFAQSIFQLGGNGGTAIGPLLIAFIVFPLGQKSIALFVIFALIGASVLWRVSKWYQKYLQQSTFKKNAYNEQSQGLSKARIWISIIILLVLIFSKYFFTASISSYYVFYLEERFGLSETESQIHLFLYLIAFTVGTLVGGPLGDKIGRKKIIWFSIL
ncbi:MAG TPA: MFS transporter, partial [Fluviicola sp.]|nr:MFS transporter [Fluviicola sp.]